MKTLILLATFCFSAVALAHVQPDHTEPKVGSTVTSPPREVKIWYDGPVGVAKSHIAVTDAAGTSVAAGDLHGDDHDNTVLILPIKAARGTLTVKWDAYCPDCDHTTHGTFKFTVGP